MEYYINQQFSNSNYNFDKRKMQRSWRTKFCISFNMLLFSINCFIEQVKYCRIQMFVWYSFVNYRHTFLIKSNSTITTEYIVYLLYWQIFLNLNYIFIFHSCNLKSKILSKTDNKYRNSYRSQTYRLHLDCPMTRHNFLWPLTWWVFTCSSPLLSS